MKSVATGRNAKKKYLIFFAFVAAIVFTSYLLFRSPSFIPPIVVFEADPSLRLHKVEYDKPTIDQVKYRISSINQLITELRENTQLKSQLATKCDSKTHYEQIMDVECSALWIYHLKYGKITAVKEFLGFSNTHWGGIILVIDDKYKALYKPCSTEDEIVSSELIVSHMNQILQYGTTAPVASRRIKFSELKPLSSSKPLQETISICGTSNEEFEGTMIGWWDNLIPIRTVNKYRVEVEKMDEMRMNLSYNLHTTQMASKFHSLYWLISILRHGKDEFISNDGHLVALDLDRAKFHWNVEPTDPHYNFTWCYTCYFDASIVQYFKLMNMEDYPENRLSSLLSLSFSTEDIYPDLITSELGEILDRRVTQYLGCVDSCVQRYGYQDVVLSYSSNMTPMDIVRWFVDHSKYEDRNGRRPPERFGNV